jgi:L-asparaginase / beta-aspartyl-peptidase
MGREGTRKTAGARGCVLAIHGGAGVIRREDLSRALEARISAALERSLRAGHAIFEAGGPALDAVVAAVQVLEDSPLFNAGRGAVYNADGRHELDAAIMDGATLRAGGVTCVRRIRNPVAAARAVMEKSAHVLLAGPGAERFARRNRIELVAPGWFDTLARRAALERERQGRARRAEDVHGTVGAVALDRAGHLAAATSTGGTTGKLPGRVGDSPIVGAGTYADDDACAVSGTGIGEFYIRTCLAYDVAARMRYSRARLDLAAAAALERMASLGGSGGLVAIDRRGRVAAPFNTEGMYRGWITRAGRATVAIYR